MKGSLLLITNQSGGSLTLAPRAWRNTGPMLDLGYSYDALDFITDLFELTNATLNVSAGTAVACYNETGLWLADGSAIVSVGTPLQPNWFVRYSSIQEQPPRPGAS